MTELRISVPPALARFLESRLVEGRYADAGDYLRDLIRRDQAEAEEDSAWVRAKVEEGLALGVIDKDASEVLKEIIAELHDEDG